MPGFVRLAQISFTLWFRRMVLVSSFMYMFFSPTEHGRSGLVSLGGRPEPSLVTFNLRN
jgi:hypothetical protein